MNMLGFTAARVALVAGALTIVADCTAWAQAAPAASPPPPLVKFEIKNNKVDVSLTGKPGDPAKGQAVMVNRQLGNCLACHAVEKLNKEPFHGNVGPSLDGVASRMSEGEIRLRVIDGTKVNAETMMPPFYRVDGLNRVIPRFQGRTILTPEQVEDVVAFLVTIK